MIENSKRQEDLQNAVLYLDQALQNHSIWYHQIIRTLACRQANNIQEFVHKTDRECSLGQWYYHFAQPELHKHPSFIALGDAHEYAHKLALQLLETISADKNIVPYDYDKFTNSIERLQLAIISLKQEIESSLYARDPITGVISQDNLQVVLQDIQDLYFENKINYAIALAQIDNFEDISSINNTIANDVIYDISRYLMNNMRGYDKVLQYGPAEFLICITNVDPITAFDKVEELRKGLALVEIDSHKQKINVTASFGVTMFDAKISMQQNIDKAHAALNSAKKSGKNCVVILENAQNS